jgi:hypothetical protein
VAEEEEVARRDRDEVVEDRSEFLGFDDAITFDEAISGGGGGDFPFSPSDFPASIYLFIIIIII